MTYEVPRITYFMNYLIHFHVIYLQELEEKVLKQADYEEVKKELR